MHSLNCIIIDDEPLARKGLKEYIADVDFLILSGEYDNPLKANKILGEGEVQLIFLDVQMPKITGLEFIKTLQHPPPVVFTTAYPQFALDGFDLNAIDYLVKPVPFERFLRAALKAKEYYEVRQKSEHVSAEDKNKSDNFFFIKSDNKLVKILFDEMLFVEALQNYVAVYTTQKRYITYLTFKSIEDYLPHDQFIKTHKSFIVCAACIDQIDGNEICIGTHRIPISRSQKEEVLEKLLKGRYLRR